MQVSFLIVTKNRPSELAFTLDRLKGLLDLSIHEVLVFIDGCSKTEVIVANYQWVNWTISDISISASPARNALYRKATGTILIGLDDDAHPLNEDCIAKIETVFSVDSSIGIIAFQEIRGVYETHQEALLSAESAIKQYYTNGFVGCGFAIRKEVYDKTRGFPIWIDIYGEEPCLAIEVIELGFEILYSNEIIVNHRVDKKKRLAQGRNYFRFEKQLKNAIYYYLVYYPKPTFKIIRLLVHNFEKYAVTDKRCFVLFFKSIFTVLLSLSNVLKFRKPVSKDTLQKVKSLKSIKY